MRRMQPLKVTRLPLEDRMPKTTDSYKKRRGIRKEMGRIC
jgi:hypothetical protein